MKSKFRVKMLNKIFILLILINYNYGLKSLFWNLRTFGENRAKPEYGNELSKIVEEFDLLLFAELRDWNCYTTDCYLKSYFKEYLSGYELFITPPLHYCDKHHSGAEEYGIFIKENIHPIEKKIISYSGCEFIRPPWGIYIQTNELELVIIVFHSMPGSKNELVALDKVFQEFSVYSKNILLMGDLNTGCEYTSFDYINKFNIGKSYEWILSKSDFTNEKLNCPYDRIIATHEMKKHISKSGSLTENNEALRINSDHYPIFVEIN